MKITVIGGGGYVGLVTAVCLAEKGNTVWAVDSNHKKVEMLNTGHSPILEEGLEPLLANGLNDEKLHFTTDLKAAIENRPQVIILALGTPEGENGRCDTAGLFTVARKLADLLEGGEIVVIKSTVPVGTTEKIQQILDRPRKSGLTVMAAMCPEFLREGSAVKDFMEPSRTVIGTNHKEAYPVLAKLFKDFAAPVIQTSPQSAELAKYAANAYLATRLSFINEIGEICEAFNSDLHEVAHIMGMDPRIGSHYLRPGIGFGGPCLVKDLKSLILTAQEAECGSELLESVYYRNERQMFRVVQKLRTALGWLNNKNIGIIGMTFKAGTNDLRNSPAVRLALSLRKMKARIEVFDPILFEIEGTELEGNVTLAGDVYELAKGKDAIVFAADWPAFNELDFQKLVDNMSSPNILDARCFLDKNELIKWGANYMAIGSPTNHEFSYERVAVK